MAVQTGAVLTGHLRMSQERLKGCLLSACRYGAIRVGDRLYLQRTGRAGSVLRGLAALRLLCNAISGVIIFARTAFARCSRRESSRYVQRMANSATLLSRYYFEALYTLAASVSFTLLSKIQLNKWSGCWHRGSSWI